MRCATPLVDESPARLGRCVGVAGDVEIEFGDLQPIRVTDHLAEDLRTADDPCPVEPAHGFRDRGRSARTVLGPVLLPSHHDVVAAGERSEALRERIPGLAAHHHGRAEGDVLEMRQVFRHVPGHPALGADHAAVGLGPDQPDPGHTATAALIGAWCW